MTRVIEFFDTTLRDGEQTPGVNFNTQEKVQLALQLEAWGVDVIEAGFPNTSEGDFEAVQAISKAMTTTTVAALARSSKEDIDRAVEALAQARDKQLHVFLATSPIHRESKLNMTKEEVLESIQTHVSYAAQFFDKLQFSPEDATRTEWDFLAQAVETAIQAGANIINIPDTVGYTTPTEFGKLFQYLKANVPSFDKAIFACHCHDDLGMAVANSMAAIENGASRVEGTVNGIGERAGNAALEEVAVALHIRNDHYQAKSNIKLDQTKVTSDLVARLSGMPVPRNKAVIGANAYAHESGIHQDGVLKNPETYEIITPQLVGVPSNDLPLGKLSGRHAFSERMKELGYDLTDPDKLKAAFIKFKDLADKKKLVTTTDLHALMTGKDIEAGARYQLARLNVQNIDEGIHAATVAVYDVDNEKNLVQETSTGPGSVEAIFQAINKIASFNYPLREYYVDAISKGSDSQAQVHVTIENVDGIWSNGTGIDFDVLTASAKAYLQAIR